MTEAFMPSEVLFVSHEATRTGAPSNLLHFLRWYEANGRRSFSILLGVGGVLAPEFKRVADTWTADGSRWCPGGIRARLLADLGLSSWARRGEIADIRRFAERSRHGLVYANSIASAALIDDLALRVPLLTHVHELSFMFQGLENPALSRMMSRTRRFVACSAAVRTNLIEGQGVAEDRVETVHESIAVRELSLKRSRREVFEELDIPEGASLVVGSGTLNWIKGPDLFIQLARAVCRERGDVFFVWVGGGPSAEVERFRHDVRFGGISARVRLTGAVENPVDYFAAGNVFVLTSRQDSYPLVCLEAAAVAKPIVCFAGAGGMPEFVEGDCGYAVAYLDVGSMAERVVKFLNCPEHCRKMGEAAQRKVTTRHDINVAAPKIADIIERTIAGE